MLLHSPREALTLLSRGCINAVYEAFLVIFSQSYLYIDHLDDMLVRTFQDVRSFILHDVNADNDVLSLNYEFLLWFNVYVCF